MIDFYLGEEPILNNVPTYVLSRPDDLAYTLDHLAELVVKEVAGLRRLRHARRPTSSESERRGLSRSESSRRRDRFIAPADAVAVDCADVRRRSASQPRHIDLRPSCCPARQALVPGGLTRVALREGSLVVNSSQGGGVKDTWVVD